MKLDEIKNLDVAGLHKELDSLIRTRFNARIQLATQQSNNTAQVRVIRRGIARAMTLLRQKGVKV